MPIFELDPIFRLGSLEVFKRPRRIADSTPEGEVVVKKGWQVIPTLQGDVYKKGFYHWWDWKKNLTIFVQPGDAVRVLHKVRGPYGYTQTEYGTLLGSEINSDPLLRGKLYWRE